MAIARNMSRNATNSEENGLRNTQFIFTMGQCTFAVEGGVILPVVVGAEKGHGLPLMAPFGMNFDSSLTMREAKSRDRSLESRLYS